MKKIIFSLAIIAILGGSSLFAGGQGDSGSFKIGVSLPTQRQERWVRDKEAMEAYAKKIGVTLIVQVSFEDQAMQTQQVENLLSQGISVLIIAPHDASASTQIVESAKAEGVSVISYDRLVTGTDKIDYYLSFDNYKVGQLQSEYLVSQVPKGNIMVFAGAPTDNNAKLFYEGAMSFIQPKVDSGDITILNGKNFLSRAIDNWIPSNAQRMAEDVLTRTSDIQGVLAPNDGTAGGVIEALRTAGLVGIPITGQDAEISAVKRIKAGEQSMTIFKDTRELGKTAIDVAVSIAKGEQVDINDAVDNGVIDVPSILLTPIIITQQNYNDLIKTGYIKQSDIN